MMPGNGRTTPPLQGSLATLLAQRNVNLAMIDQVLVSGVNFLTGILIARALGIQQFGVFHIAWIAVILASNLQLAVIISPMMSIGPKQSPSITSAYYGAAFVQQISFAVLSAVVLYGGAATLGALFPETAASALALPLAVSVLGLLVQDFIRRYFFTLQRPERALATDAVSYIGQLSGLIWLFGREALTIPGALWVMAASSTVAAGLGLIWMDRLSWNTKVFKESTRRHFHFAKWMGASALVQVAAIDWFVLVAAWSMGAIAAGAIKAAQKVISVLNIFFLALENVVPTEASRRYHGSGRSALSNYLSTVTRVGGLATAVVALLVGMFAPPLIGVLYGAEFVEHAGLLRWFAAAYFVGFFGTPLRAWLTAVENTAPIFWTSFLMFVFSLVAAYPLNLLFGLPGTMAGILMAFVLLHGALSVSVLRSARMPDSADFQMTAQLPENQS